jgi:hypothetical protein
VIETFDGFRYDLKIGKVIGDNHPVTATVTAEIAKERTPAADEKPEDKARLDSEFAGKQKKLEEKLAQEKKFEGRMYLVAKYSVEPLLKERNSLLPDKPAEPAKAPEGTSPAPGTTPAAGAPAAPAGSPKPADQAAPPPAVP